MSYEQLLAAVVASPEDDAPRIAFAEHVRSNDPELARFIEVQLAAAKARRESREGRRTVIGAEDRVLLQRNATRWGHTIQKYSTRFDYDRGFISKIVIEPNLFLEYGEWLYTNAPIRHVGFTKPQEGAFPIDELTASPLLSRLDSLDFTNCGIGDPEIAKLTRSPHLERLLYLDLSWVHLSGEAYEALAASAATRKALVVVRSGHNVGAPLPGERYETIGYDRDGAPEMGWAPMSPAGVALEHKYGYIPWLHPRDNGCDAFDAAWYVAKGMLPIRTPG